MRTHGRAVPAWAGVVPLAAIVSGCLWHSVKSEPIEIKPIHITMDINLKVQRELDEFFDYEKPAATAAGPTTTPPTNKQP